MSGTGNWTRTRSPISVLTGPDVTLLNVLTTTPDQTATTAITQHVCHLAQCIICGYNTYLFYFIGKFKLWLLQSITQSILGLRPQTTTCHRRRHHRRHRQKLSTSSTSRSWSNDGLSRCSITPRTKSRLEYRRNTWCSTWTGDVWGLSIMTQSSSTKPSRRRQSHRCVSLLLMHHSSCLLSFRKCTTAAVSTINPFHVCKQSYSCNF